MLETICRFNVKVCSMTSTETETLISENYATTHSAGLENILRLEQQPIQDIEQTNKFHVTQTNDVKERNAVHSAPSHFSAEVNQNLTEILLSSSEQYALEDSLALESTISDDWSEAASGWHCVVPYPNYITHQPPKQQKAGSVPKKISLSSQTATHFAKNKNICERRSCSSWRAFVEPVTYCYVPNNGYYRSNKLKQDVQEWLTSKKEKSAKSVITQHMRRVQKPFKKDLTNHIFPCKTDESLMKPPAHLTLKDTSSDGSNVAKHLRECPKMKAFSDVIMQKFKTGPHVSEIETHTSGSYVSAKTSSEFRFVSNQSIPKINKIIVPDLAKLTVQNPKQPTNNFVKDLFAVPSINKPEVQLRPLEKLTSLTSKQKKARKKFTEEMNSSQGKEYITFFMASTSQQSLNLSKKSMYKEKSDAALTKEESEQMQHVQCDRKQKSFIMQQDNRSSMPRNAEQCSVTSSNGQIYEPNAAAEKIHPRAFSLHSERHTDKVTECLETKTALSGVTGKRLPFVTANHRFL